MSVSVFAQKHWQITPNGVVLLWQKDLTPPPLNAEYNYIPPAAALLAYQLAEVMNLGAYGLSPGSVRWRGDSFSALQSEVGLPVEGTLVTGTNSLPREMKLRYFSASERRLDFLVVYSYARDTGLAYIPSGIRRIRLFDPKGVEDLAVEIQSIKPAERPLSEMALAPSTNLLAVPAVRQFYTNGHYYTLNSAGALMRGPRRHLRGMKLAEGRVAYLAACALMTAAIFVLAVRAKTKDRSKSTGVLERS